MDTGCKHSVLQGSERTQWESLDFFCRRAITSTRKDKERGSPQIKNPGWDEELEGFGRRDLFRQGLTKPPTRLLGPFT